MTAPSVAERTQVVCVVALVVAVLCTMVSHQESQRSGDAAQAWLTLGLVVVVGHLLIVVVTTSVTTLETTGTRVPLLLTFAALVAVRLASLEERPVNRPLLAGAVLATALGLVHVALLVLAPPSRVDTGLAVGFALAIVAIHVFAGLLAWPRKAATWSARQRLVCFLVLSGVATAGHVLSPTGTAGLVVHLAQLATLLLLATFALERLSTSQRNSESKVDVLRREVERAEMELRHHRRRLHEIDSTVAGIASANRLIREHSTIHPARAERLQDMISSEVGRLERLARDAAPTPWSILDLDELVESLVVSHRARGRLISWSPSHIRAMGRADHLSAVVNILLENAARHGGGAAVSVSMHRVDDTVQIAVADEGPGIDATLRDEIFEWGSRRQGSPGQGIGLSAARDLMVEQGGYLRLVESDRGACFTVGLQLAAQDLVAARSA